jgi:uncharacterized protein
MPTTPTEPVPGDAREAGPVEGSDERVAYIRGGAGLAVDPRKAIRVLVGLLLVVLAVLVVVLGIQATHQNSRMSRLQQHGVPVDAVVTGCVGLASGTGATEAGFICRGTFSVDGRRYNEVIEGTQNLYPTGAVVHAITVPGDPALLSTAHAVATAHASWRAFITPGILLVVLLLASALALWRARRTRDGPVPSPGPVVAPPSAAAPSATTSAQPPAPLPRSGKICYLEIPATDIEVSARFYREVFGWQTRQRSDGVTAFDDTPGQVSGVWVLDRAAATQPGILTYILVAQAGAALAAVLAAGGAVVVPVDPDADEIFGWFSDPAGNVLGVYQQSTPGSPEIIA